MGGYSNNWMEKEKCSSGSQKKKKQKKKNKKKKNKPQKTPPLKQKKKNRKMKSWGGWFRNGSGLRGKKEGGGG